MEAETSPSLPEEAPDACTLVEVKETPHSPRESGLSLGIAAGGRSVLRGARAS